MSHVNQAFKLVDGGILLEDGIGPHWNSWRDLEGHIKRWGETRFVLLRCVDSKRTDIYNNSREKPFVKGHQSYIDPEKTDFAYKTYACVQGGRRRTKKAVAKDNESQLSHSMPRTRHKTLDIGCGFRIHAAYRPYLGCIVITSVKCSEEVPGSTFAPGHNHPTSKDIFDRYPQNLKMSEGEVARQEELLSWGVSAPQAARLLRDETGKPFTAKHIHNERAWIKERARMGRTDLQVVRETLSAFRARFPSLKYEICTRKETVQEAELESSLERIANSSKSSQEIRNVEVINVLLPGGMEFGRLYGEVILLDGTYNTNSLSYPLILISVEDCFGCTRIVQMSVVVSENEETIGRALSFYKRHVGDTLLRTIIIDKDCREQAAIESCLPGVRILFCRWHVIRYIYQMISEKVVGNMDLKRAVRQTARDMVYARTEEEYMNLYSEMSMMLSENNNAEPESFGQYFDRNWHEPGVRAKWTQYGRFGCVTFSNDTNNRAEAMNAIVKKRTKRSFRLKDLISALLDIADEGVFNFKNLAVKATMYVPMPQRTSELASFFMKHVAEAGSRYLCTEASKLSLLHVEPQLNPNVHSLLEENESSFAFEVTRRNLEEGVGEQRGSDISVHNVSMSVEASAKIRDALESCRRRRSRALMLSEKGPSTDESADNESSFGGDEVYKDQREDPAPSRMECTGIKRPAQSGKSPHMFESDKDPGGGSTEEAPREGGSDAEEWRAADDEKSDESEFADKYLSCAVVEVGSNDEEALLKCNCFSYFAYGGLPCRHVLAVLEHEFTTAAILLAVPRRWWVRNAVRVAQEIHTSMSAGGLVLSDKDELVQVANSRYALSSRASKLGSRERLPVFQKICMDLAYLCADSRKVPNTVAEDLMRAVEGLTEKVRKRDFRGIEEFSGRMEERLLTGDVNSLSEDEDSLDSLPATLKSKEVPEVEPSSVKVVQKETSRGPEAETDLKLSEEVTEGHSLFFSPPGKQPGRPKLPEKKRRVTANISNLTSSIRVKRRRRGTEEREADDERKVMNLSEAADLFGSSKLSHLQQFVVENPQVDFPRVISEKSYRVRRFTSSQDPITEMLRKELRICADFRLHFVLKDAGRLAQEALKKLVSPESLKAKGTDSSIGIEKCSEDTFGAVIEVLTGPYAESYYVNIRQLKMMADTAKAIKVLQEAKRLLLWVSRMADLCAFDEKDSSTPLTLKDSLCKGKIEVLHAVALIKSVLSDLPVCCLNNGEETFQDHGVIYDMQTLCSVRGNISNHQPLWLHSDLIQAYLHRLCAALPSSLRHFTFFMPMFEWMPTRHARRYSLEVFLDRLRSEKHPLLEATKENLANGLIYAVCNVNDSHWTAVEVDIAASVAFVYDPAVSLGSMFRKNHADRVLDVLRHIAKEKGLQGALPVSVRVVQAPGGQQELASDTYNCGVHAMMWVRFRLMLAAKLVSEEAKKVGKVLKRTPRKVLARNKRMRDRTARELDLARMAILYDISRFIDATKRKSPFKKVTASK